MKQYKVVWDVYAIDSLRSIIEYIKKDSPTAAQSVKKEILVLTRSLKDKPKRFSKEPYLAFKKGDYRSVSLWSFKIIYSIKDNQVRILDVFHGSKSPDKIQKIK